MEMSAAVPAINKGAKKPATGKLLPSVPTNVAGCRLMNGAKSGRNKKRLHLSNPTAPGGGRCKVRNRPATLEREM
jgi:hypothetical protein